MSRELEPRWAVSGVIEARPDKVWEALVTSTPGLTDSDKKAILRQRQGDSGLLTFTAGKSGEGKTLIEVDSKAHSIAVQGEWWYRGVYSVESHGRGSQVIYRIYNVAPGPGWWVARFVQGPHAARDMKPQFEKLLARLSNDLGASARVTG